MTACALWATVAATVPGFLRNDRVVAALLAAVSLVQVLVVAPIGPRRVGAFVALGSTVPIAFRHTHPVRAALAGSAIWLVPTDGYVVVGYVAAFLLFYSLAVEVDDARVVAAVAGLGALYSIPVTILNHEAYGEYFGSLSAVVAPAV